LKAFCDKSGNRSAGGKQFQEVGPLMAKLRCPIVVRVRGTSRVPVVADRSCCRPQVDVAGMQRSLRYARAMPWTHFQTNKAVLKTTR